MPRLNYGTLLENVVVFEATRSCFGHLGDEDSLAFATSFAMPPLTQCWASSGDILNSPAFGFSALQKLAQSQPNLLTLQGLWSLCLTNQPNVPVCSYTVPRVNHATYERGGPNGSLLAALLAAQCGRTIHLWINDDGARYGDAQGLGPTSKSEVPELLIDAGTFVGSRFDGTIRHNPGTFPGTIEDLEHWLGQVTVAASSDDANHPPNSLKQWPALASVARVGFLDPDGYIGSGASISRENHSRWLRTLGAGCQQALSMMFFGVRSAGVENAKRNMRILAFQQDELKLFPRSLIFQYGSAMTGVKVRWLAGSIDKCVADLRNAVETTWDDWSPSIPHLKRRQRLKKLTVHVDGQPAI